ncbi:MAG: hypothetical protein JWM05_753 [Acidimicrobiales bacterium]|nr:hypothetical protein [Acidimicrobiales bacterium]
MAQQELGSGKTTERPIRLGGALVTIVEPHRGHEVAYNRWYERDHFYAGCMIGAWTISGARFVCTRDLKELRYPDPSPVVPDRMGGSYMAVYWVLAGGFGQWITWGTEQVKWLIEHDRMFPHRDHVHTLMYKFRTEYEEADGVPVELALDHRSPYVVFVVGQPAPGVDLDQVDAWFRDRPHLGTVGAELTAIPMAAGAPSDVPRDEAADRFSQLWFVDDEIHDVWDERFAKLGDEFAAAGLGELVFVSPFRATVPGTDAFTDSLW